LESWWWVYQGRQNRSGEAVLPPRLPDAIRKQGIQGDLRERKFLSKKLTELGVEHGSGQGWGALQLMLFEAVAEKHLVDPTFIVDSGRGLAARAPPRFRP